ncbi:hypothetical protein ABPG72_015786 [Tetrahymena utriculariae]
MSQSQQLTKEMHDLIKSIGETRSKQEEDKIILAEQAKLKVSIKDQSLSTRRQKENLIKAIYIEMLGHDASFAHFSAVQMAQSKSLQMKRLGYLTCCLFLNEQSDLLILLVANLQKDLQSKNIHEVVIALTALGKLMNKTILQGVLDQVIKLLIHHTDLVRKKAIMVLQRIHNISPDSIPDYDDKMRRALCDFEPSVMGVALNLYLEAVKEDPTKYKESAGSFVLILKQVIEHKLPREFDYARIPAPWIQIKILQILAILGKKDQKVSEQIYEILGQALRRSDDSGSKIGFAVTYQCVKTIATIYPYQSLLEQAASAVQRFLTAENNNLKYLGINALISIVQVNAAYVHEHQLIIIDCLESNDETLKKETMELLYKMTNVKNVEAIVGRLIVFLKTSSDPFFRRNLVNKITSLADRHSPSNEWFLKTMNLVFEYGSEYISSDILNTFLKTLNENFSASGVQFGTYLIDTYLETIKKPNLSDVTYQMIAWVFGEIGAATYGNDEAQLQKLIECLLESITSDFEHTSTRGWFLNALAKLSSCSAFNMQEQVAACFDYYGESRCLEVSSRSTEYKILSKYNAALRQSSAIKVDTKLNFLNDFIERSVKNGAPRFDSNKIIQAVISNDKALNFAPVDTRHTAKSDQEEVLKIANNKANPWGQQGFVEPELPAKSTQQKEADKGQKSISYKDYQNEPYIPGTDIWKKQDKGNDKPSLNPTAPVKKVEPEDTKKKQQTKMAEKFFGGITTTGPTTTTTTTVTTTTTKPVVYQNSNPYGQASSANSQAINLLEDDDLPTQTPQQKAGPAFTPININVEQYETYWEQFRFEENQDIKSNKVKTEYEFRNMLTNIGIGVVEVDNNELICAGKNISSQNIMLLYGSYTALGNLSITMKSNSKQEIDQIFNTIKTRFV